MKTPLFFASMSDFPITELRPNHEHWPKLLSQISDPPKQLYCRGNLNLLNKECFAVVGTRKLTNYGKDAAQHIVRGLANSGFVIVSGLALGIDAVAHQTTLDCGGATIAVLGGGVSDNSIGPITNLPLAKNILKNGGLLISEYSDKETIFATNFAARDRIISGLTKGVLVIEAPEKSGALITARCALDQNRDVFAIPGNIFSSNSVGPNTLVKKGAKLVTSVQDILDEYGSNLNLFQEENSSLSTKDPAQNVILDILNEHDILSMDEMIRKSNLEASAVAVSLSMLEIRGIIKNLGNGKYRKV
ncbi:MAG: DNA-processing protein DprA [Candidatus Paceibacterota bacterium]